MSVTMEHVRIDLPAQGTHFEFPSRDPRRKGWWLVAGTAASIGMVAALVIAFGPGPQQAPLGTISIDAQRAISRAAGVSLPPSSFGKFGSVRLATGTRRQGEVHGLGLVQLAPNSNQVLEIIWETRLTSGPADRISASSAANVSALFARSHIQGFDTLESRSMDYIDHGSWREYRSTFQARSGEAWLPRQITVGVNAGTGEVSYYWSELTKPSVEVSPRVSASEALEAARALVRRPAAFDSPSLEVVVENGGQKLTWIVPASPLGAVGSPRVLQQQLIFVDAITGAAAVGGRAS